MATMVGARMEVVAPPRITDAGDRLRLFALLVVSVAVHAWLLTHTTVTSRDGIGFARMALQIQNPNFDVPPDAPRRTIIDVFGEFQHPPGYAMTVAVVSHPVKYLYHSDLPSQMLLATQVTSAIGGVLLLFPVYWVGRTLFGKFAGFAAAAMTQCLPVFARVTADGLTEGMYLFLFATTLMLAVRAVRTPAVGSFLLTGLAVGLTYLVRPEGLLVGLGVGAVGFGLGLTGRWPRGQAVGRLTALAVGFGVAAGPYMYLIGGLSNKPSSGPIIKPLKSLVNTARAETPAHAGPLFAAWYVPGKDGPKAVWAAGAIVKEGLKAIHYVPAFLAVGGLWFARRRLRGEPWVAVPVVCLGINLCVIVALVATKTDDAGRSYVSERHMMPIALIGLLFAAGMLEPLGRWLGERLNLRPMAVAVAVLLAICLSGLPSIAKPLHANRAGHVEAGRWLRDNTTAADTIVDPFAWAEFFAGRTLFDVPADPNQSGVVYAVLEGPSEDEPNSHLPRHEAAMNVARDGRSNVVYQWPTGVPVEQAEIRIFRLRQ